MNWKSGLMTLVAASVAVVHAAGQANAPARQPGRRSPRRPLLPAKPVTQPKVEARKAPIITVAGLKFRDLNKNGKLDPYEDWRLPVDRRVADLVAKMTLEEKAGLMIHSSLSGFTGPNGEVLGLPAAGQRGGGPARRRDGARRANRAFEGGAEPEQRRADGQREPGAARSPSATSATSWSARTRASRPTSRRSSTTACRRWPRRAASASPSCSAPTRGTASPVAGRQGPARARAARPTISQWPDELGLAVGRDPDQVRRFGQIAAKELRAIGIQCLLGPMADIITEPRWNRINGTFGEDPDLVDGVHQGDRRGLPGQAARARERDDRHQALPRRRPGEGRLRRPQLLRQVVHLSRQPVRPPPASLQGRVRGRQRRRHDRLRHPGRQGHRRDRVLEGDGRPTCCGRSSGSRGWWSPTGTTTCRGASRSCPRRTGRS